MRYTGTLKIWNDERGFGFLEPTQGGPEIFVHIKAFPLSNGRPFAGQVLTFEIETGPDGKKKARAVQFPLRAKQRPQQRYETVAPWTLPRALAIPIFIGIYIYVVIRWGFSLPVLLTYLGLSILAFLFYGVAPLSLFLWLFGTPARRRRSAHRPLGERMGKNDGSDTGGDQ